MKRLLTVLLFSVIAVQAFGQAVPALLVPADSRQLAMGGVTSRNYSGTGFAALGAGIWAPRSASSTVLALDGYMIVDEKLVLGLEGRDFIDRPYNVSDKMGGVTGTFKPYDLFLSLYGAYRISGALGAGLKLTSVTSDISPKAKGSAFCGDVWVRYGGSGWSASVEGRNLGGKINYGGGDYALPALAAVCGDWSPLHGLTLAAEADYLFSGAFMAGAGAEYCFADIAYARAGFHYGDASGALPTFASLGLGARYAGAFLDAGVLLLSQTLGTSFLVTLGYGF